MARVVVVSPHDTRISRARAKTDRLDARALAKLLAAGELNAVWMSSGRMRPEFSSTDFGMLLWLGDALHGHAGHVDATLWRRYVEALLDGLIAEDEPREPLSVAALDFERMDVVVRKAKPTSRRRAPRPKKT